MFRRIFLPLIFRGGRMPETVSIPVPNGVVPHLTNSQAIQDGAGVIFAATRQNSNQGGGIVWRVVDGVPDVVLNPGLSEAYGNGELVVWPDGYARYVTVKENKQMVAYVVPKFVPVKV